MATAYTSLLGFALPVTGELSGTWGDVVNNSITSLVEASIAGSATADVTSGNWTLTTTGSGAANEARAAILIPTGTPGTTRNIIAPSSSKAYIVDNQSDGAVVVKGSATTGATVAAGTAALVAWDGTDFVLVAQDLANASGTLPATKGGTGLTSPGASGNILTSNGTAWTSAAPAPGGIEYVYKTANYTTQNNEGVLADTSGGAFTVTLPATPSTGDQCVVADAGSAFGTNNLTVGRNGSTIGGLAENLILDITGVSVQFVYDGTTWEVYAQIGGNGGMAVTLDGVQTLTNKTINGSNNTLSNISLSTAVTGTLPVANGGTGATSLTANNVLLGNGTSAVQVVAPGTTGNVLTSNGTTWTSAAPPGAAIEEFTTSGTWTKPAGATTVMVEVWGAGGGGGSGRRGIDADRTGGSGGGGGARITAVFDASDLTSTVTVTIGAGGTGGAAITADNTNGSNGTAGGNTTFGAYLTGFGGGGGGGGTASTGIYGGGGGGSISAGQSSTLSTTARTGGLPNSTNFGSGTNPNTLGTGGAASGGLAEYGGGGGGLSQTAATATGGGSSCFAGAAGGGGGAQNAGTSRAGGAGGISNSYAVGGGAAGGAAGGANNGGNGAVSTVTGGGGGGGGGGASSTTAAGAGGNGATPSGGGGGGGVSTNSYNSGAGGTGGDGFCRVYVW